MPSTKETLLPAAAAVLANNPGASFSEIAQLVGVGRATLYRHFADRKTLIKELTLLSLREIDEAMKPIYEQNLSALETLCAMLDCLIPMGERYHFLSHEFDGMDNEGVVQIYNRQLDELMQLVQAAREEGAIALDIPVAWIVTVIDILIYTAWISVQEGYIAPRDATDLVYRTLISGFGA